ncbi:hypothetical protein CPAV1605_155 [seawater metagenome]|uniref:Uncharacterized protein n=1 Tax=seawater metagenome TaxID=1561972 RepID=A0A5E8CG61_9ZZZZ
MDLNIIPDTIDLDIPTIGYEIEYTDKEVIFKINKQEQYIIELIKKLKNDNISNDDIIDRFNSLGILIDTDWCCLEIEHTYLTYLDRHHIGLQKIKDLPDTIIFPIKLLKLDKVKEVDFYLWNKSDLPKCNSDLCQLRKHFPNIKINVKIGVKENVIKRNYKNINNKGYIIYKQLE